MKDAKLDPKAVETLARAMWSHEWKLQNPGADREALKACWGTARAQQIQSTRKLMATMKAKGFAIVPIKD